MLFRTTVPRLLCQGSLLRAGAVQDCFPQGWCHSGLVSSGLVAVQGCSPQAVGLQLWLAMAAFRKPFGTANGSI